MAKNYPIDQSRLYRLQSKRKLAELLGIERTKLVALVKNPASYRVFTRHEDGKSRVIEEPLGELRRVHDRLSSLFSRVEAPPYLHSGVKRRSYISNAKAHLGQGRIAKTDIKKFFPSTTHRRVFVGFLTEFRCSGDVARLLADICTYEGHVPTGSPISMPAAFFASKQALDGMYHRMLRRNINLTVYVDDITLSGPRLTRADICPIKRALGDFGLVAHKTRFFGIRAASVTGVIVKGNEILLPNRRHQRIANGIKAFSTENSPESLSKAAETLRGKINEAANVDAACRARSIGYKNMIARMLAAKRLQTNNSSVPLVAVLPDVAETSSK